MIVGMDFGTTNSGMSVYDGDALRVLPLDPVNENPRVLRTALYVTNEQEVVIGRAAVDEYFAQNVGRPVKLQKVWVGELEVYGADMYFVTDTYVWVDVMSPGRLFLSFKTNLRDHEYTGTVIGQSFYPIEALLALYLTVARKRAERLLGRELRQVVLGRPVHFASDPQHDALAQERLLRGAFLAGYEKVYLAREPIAAAYDYASRATRAQNILVFDFGGGTLDITVMRIDGRQRQVLATGGVPIAGDVFDQKLVRAKLPRHFGEGTPYGPRQMPSPAWIYDLFSNWQTILELQTPKNLRVLQEIEQGSPRPGEIRGLISLVSGNHGLQMFDTVEKTKRDLSARFGAMIRLDGPEFHVLELVTRREFENVIRSEVHAIERELLATVQASGLRPAQIDAVIRTGGSSQIPIFQEMLGRNFGPDKLQALDTFSSVTAGLGIIGHGIATGEIAGEAYKPEQLTPLPPRARERTRPGVKPVNLELLQRRIAAQEAGETVQAAAQVVLVLLTQENQLRLTLLPAAAFAQPEPMVLAALLTPAGVLPAPRAVLTAGIDDTLLLVTSKYRFLLITVRQLVDGQALGMKLADLYHFKPDEQIFALARWAALKAQERIVMVTSLGYVRGFPTPVMVAAIEAPVPWSFENPLPGWPLAVLGADPAGELVLVTDTGRGLRLPLAELPGRGVLSMNRGANEQITGVALPRPGAELLLVTHSGYARRLPAEAIELPDRPKARGKVLVSRRAVCGAAPALFGRPVWALTNKQLRPLDPGRVPSDPDSSKTYPLVTLDPQETIHCLLAG